MSVELYPKIADLDEKLSALEDTELAQRILNANPDLFTSAAAREEISIFAAAWKRFGTLALAVTAAIAVGAGFVFAPHAAVRRAAKPVAVPIVVHKIVPRTERLGVHPPRHVSVAVPGSLSHAAAAHAATPVAPAVHSTAAFHRSPAASHIAAPPAQAVAAPVSAASADAQAEAPIQYEANAQVVSSANAPPTDAVRPAATKTGTVVQTSDASMQPVVDSCTPQGGRLAYLVRN